MQRGTRTRIILLGILGAAIGGSAQAAYVDTITGQNPLFYWRLNDASNGAVAALIDNSATADSSAITVAGATLVGQSSPALSGAAYPGLEAGNTFFTFGGTNAGDFVNGLTNPKGVSSSTLGSVSYWANTTSSATNKNMFRVDAGATGALYTTFEAGKIRLRIANGSNDTTILAEILTAGTYNDGGWHHVAASWDEANSNVALYIDGGALAGGETVTGAFTNGTDFTSTGRHQWGKGTNVASQFIGSGDELAIWDRVLSPTEAAAQYNAAVPEPGSMAVLTVAGAILLRRRK